MTNSEGSGLEVGYLVAITADKNRPLYFTVHLETGAVYSRLPISSIWCDWFNCIDMHIQRTANYLQPWGGLEGPAQIFTYDLLRNSDVICRFSNDLKSETMRGNYLFTIDYHGEGLANDPEQAKSHNIIVLNHGQLAALPNNYILFTNSYFTDKSLESVLQWPKYMRQEKRYFSE